MNTLEGLRLAKSLEQLLRNEGYPIVHVFLFGSVALGTQNEDSDIDIAVVCEPFKESKHEENLLFLQSAHTLHPRIETICLHPKDMENKYSTLAHEVREYGISLDTTVASA